MAKIVEPLTRKAGPPERVLERVGHVLRVERRPDRRGEHEVSVVPARPGCEPFLQLVEAVLPKDRGHVY